jgi:Ca-activated chloride channel family protein
VSRLPDYYALLGVPRNASPEQLRRAFREAALRLHPDRNVEPGDTELFIEINEAYEALINPKSREAYDAKLEQAEQAQLERATFSCDVRHSRASLLRIGEPQVHYLLLDIHPVSEVPDERPPINLTVVIDRSTSMQGQRLDRVRSAALSILRSLEEGDSASIVAFSDRADLIVSPDQARDMSVARARLSLLQAGGGTEIGQGLKLGMEQLHAGFVREGVNHLVLLTDGRTYGDEDLCLQLANHAASRGITINGIGIGSDWSDRLVDELAARTGGAVAFFDTPRAIARFLERIFQRLGEVYASRMRLEGSLAQQVDLRASFRLHPDPMPLADRFPLMLGNLTREDMIRVLLELVIHPLGDVEELTMAHLSVTGDVLGLGAETLSLPVHISRPISSEPDPEPPPKEVLSALGHIALYRMQDKARHEAELGQTLHAARRLETLATHLLAAGERELAKAALNEASRVSNTRRLSAQGEKALKYGTRALLMLPSGSEE